jgi:5-formyltetrahydrofolate cyclo-ligase
MSNAAPDLKSSLRHRLREEMARHSPAQRAEASAQLCVRLRSQAIWQRSQGVLFFVPRPDEPDIRPLLSEALALRKTVTLPQYQAESRRYVICQVTDLAKDLRPGEFGIPEPLPSCPRFDAKHLDLVLVPGVGFNLAGSRLGRGRGFYDRLLAMIPGYKCGVAFDWQITAEVPTEPHDVRLNCILTPLLWQKVASQKRS